MKLENRLKCVKRGATILALSTALGLGAGYCGGSSGGSSGRGDTPTNNAPTVYINNPLDGSTFYRGEDIPLSAYATDPENNISYGGWDPVDGLTPIDGVNKLNGGTYNVQLDSTLGTKTLTAYAVDEEGLQGDTTVNIDILNNPPEAIAERKNVDCDSIVPYDFTRSSDLEDGNTLGNYYVDWGDSHYDNDPDGIIFHTYKFSEGSCGKIFLLKLIVTDLDGDTASDTAFINVSDNQ